MAYTRSIVGLLARRNRPPREGFARASRPPVRWPRMGTGEEGRREGRREEKEEEDGTDIGSKQPRGDRVDRWPNDKPRGDKSSVAS